MDRTLFDPCPRPLTTGQDEDRKKGKKAPITKPVTVQGGNQ